MRFLPTIAMHLPLLASGALYAAEPVRLPWNTNRSEFGASISARGNLFFYSNRDSADTNLYQSRRENGVFLPPERIDVLNSPHDDQSPFILPDESGIVFSSNRDGSHEFRTDRGIAVSRDLYYAQKKGSGWQEPQRLPDEINTDMIEENPFLYRKRLFFVRYPFGQPHLARVFFSDYSESGWSEAREAFAIEGITPGVFADRLYFARRASNGKYQIASIPLDKNAAADVSLTQTRQDLDTDADEASYAASPDNSVIVFCRRSSAGDYDLFELRGDPWEAGESFSLTSILFDSGKSEILPSSHPTLDRLAQFLKTNRTRILITGHTDRTGDAAANLAFSKRRAEAVREALVLRGVDAGMIETEGKGSAEPVDPADTPEAYALNRRTEFQFLR